MRKIYHFAFAISAVLCFNMKASFAQVPGYQGKRIAIGYKTDISLALFEKLNANYKTSLNSDLSYLDFHAEQPKSTLLAINATHNLNFDYVVKRNGIVSANIRYFKTGISYTPFPENLLFLTQVNGFGANISYKFLKHNIAPVGNYLGYGIGYNSIAADMRFNVADNPEKIKTSTWNLLLTMGKQRVFFDKLLADFSGSFDIISFFNILDLHQVYIHEEVYKKIMRKRVYSRDLVSFSIAGKYMF